MSETMEGDEIRQVLPARGAAGGACSVQLCTLCEFLEAGDQHTDVPDELIPSRSLIWVSFSWLHSINISCSPGLQQQTHPHTDLLLLLLWAHAGTDTWMPDRCLDLFPHT